MVETLRARLQVLGYSNSLPIEKQCALVQEAVKDMWKQNQDDDGIYYSLPFAESEWIIRPNNNGFSCICNNSYLEFYGEPDSESGFDDIFPTLDSAKKDYIWLWWEGGSGEDVIAIEDTQRK